MQGEVKQTPTGISGKDTRTGGVEWRVRWRRRRHWWALWWELDHSLGVGSFRIFAATSARGAVPGLAGRLGEKDPSVVWDYFRPDTAQDVTCLERLGGEGGREGGITGRRGTYVLYVQVGVWYGGELLVFPSYLVTVVFMSLCLMWFFVFFSWRASNL